MLLEYLVLSPYNDLNFCFLGMLIRETSNVTWVLTQCYLLKVVMQCLEIWKYMKNLFIFIWIFMIGFYHFSQYKV